MKASVGPLQTSIEFKLTGTFHPKHLEVLNESHMHHGGAGKESHFKVLVVSDAFANVSRIERQRKVNDLLQHELDNGVHALTMRLLTPGEWEKKGPELSIGDGFKSPDCLGGGKKKA